MDVVRYISNLLIPLYVPKDISVAFLLPRWKFIPINGMSFFILWSTFPDLGNHTSINKTSLLFSAQTIYRPSYCPGKMLNKPIDFNSILLLPGFQIFPRAKFL